MNYLEFLEKEIHSFVAATTDKNGLPQTCVIDVMDSDENGLYTFHLWTEGTWPHS